MKDFYFRFYARDFLTSKDVRGLSLQDQAILVRLWCICCLEGTLPTNLEELSLATGVKRTLLRSFERSLQKPFEIFFEIDAFGARFSPRLERERKHNRMVREKAAKAGRASAEAKIAMASKVNGRSNVRMDIHSHSHKQTKEPGPGPGAIEALEGRDSLVPAADWETYPFGQESA